MIFETIQTEGIAQLSYLVGDDSTGIAAVIDPQPNVESYIRLSRQHGVAITHIYETHIHADFMSGSRELQSRLGNAKIFASGEGDASYEFDVQKVHDGDSFGFESTTLTARHTPGHTPEHLSYELADSDSPSDPWGVLSGDSLFVGSAGRPDLLGSEETDKLTQQLFSTLRDYYLSLADHVIVYPCHGAGSACGANIGERPMTTIGQERKHNAFLQHQDFDEFAEFVSEGAPPVPHHYPILKKINAKGPQLIGSAPVVPGLPPKQFQQAIQSGEAQLVDTRQMLAFGGGHIDGAMNLGDRPELSVWAGDMLDYDRPILLVVEDDTRLDWVSWHFAIVGLRRFAGYLVGGMKAWDNAGLPLSMTPQLTVHDLKKRPSEFQILDVRSPSEFQSNRIPGAKHHYVAEMRDGVNGELDLNRDDPVAVYCGSGYRASIAASVLERNGFQRVHNVPGSMSAWKNAGYSIEN
ncbi:Hydroxyacylglutathione hydrolase [Rhodopirellula islandica]|uniref:Hydroxyacylglutathione hydrolase n=1 Tax=Rhodopirellula islandica TaxID=595434 RepID=A0A0J1BLR3_RHOIS|nr:MBL fold metallo-hydrolase [Rhodopirellula islandica]KLU07461.1 Hydroxyacylglutathione hydrolase [Rhodopirellula islandica]